MKRVTFLIVIVLFFRLPQALGDKQKPAVSTATFPSVAVKGNATAIAPGHYYTIKLESASAPEPGSWGHQAEGRYVSILSVMQDDQYQILVRFFDGSRTEIPVDSEAFAVDPDVSVIGAVWWMSTDRLKEARSIFLSYGCHKVWPQEKSLKGDSCLIPVSSTDQFLGELQQAIKQDGPVRLSIRIPTAGTKQPACIQHDGTEISCSGKFQLQYTRDRQIVFSVSSHAVSGSRFEQKVAPFDKGISSGKFLESDLPSGITGPHRAALERFQRIGKFISDSEHYVKSFSGGEWHSVHDYLNRIPLAADEYYWTTTERSYVKDTACQRLLDFHERLRSIETFTTEPATITICKTLQPAWTAPQRVSQALPVVAQKDVEEYSSPVTTEGFHVPYTLPNLSTQGFAGKTDSLVVSDKELGIISDITARQNLDRRGMISDDVAGLLKDLHLTVPDAAEALSILKIEWSPPVGDTHRFTVVVSVDRTTEPTIADGNCNPDVAFREIDCELVRRVRLILTFSNHEVPTAGVMTMSIRGVVVTRKTANAEDAWSIVSVGKDFSHDHPELRRTATFLNVVKNRALAAFWRANLGLMARQIRELPNANCWKVTSKESFSTLADAISRHEGQLASELSSPSYVVERSDSFWDSLNRTMIIAATNYHSCAFPPIPKQ